MCTIVCIIYIIQYDAHRSQGDTIVKAVFPLLFMIIFQEATALYTVEKNLRILKGTVVLLARPYL